MASRRRGAGPVLLSVGLLLVALGSGASAVPDAVADLRVEEATFRSVNVSFGPSPSPDVHHYRMYVSSVNATDVGGLIAPPEFGTSDPLYDVVNVTSPANASLLPSSTSPRVFFDNATEQRAPEREQQVGLQAYHVVPSDATRVYYTITNLEPNVTRFVAVTPVDTAMVENTTVSPIPVVATDVPVERLPGNEGILLTIGGILVALVAVISVLWRRSGPASRPAYRYVAPAIIALALLTFYPTAVGFFLSFTDRTLTAGQGGFDYDLVGVDNYVRIFERPEFGLVAATTIVWTVVNVFFHVTVGLVLAVLLNRKIVGRPVYRTLFLLPWAIPSYISVLAWRGMFSHSPPGVIDSVFGGSIDWLGTMPWALVAVIVTNVWLGIPFMMMVFSGGLQGIPQDLYEAADVDGLSRWQKFRHITLPLLKPTIVPASLLGFIWTFNMFNVIYLMTQGRPVVGTGNNAGATDILITYVYTEGFSPFYRQGFAAAYSVVIFLMLLAFSLSYTRYTRALESVMGERATQEPRRLGRAFARVARPFQERLWAPLATALDRDLPETAHVPRYVLVILVTFGALHLLDGAWTLARMGDWNTLTATRGGTFAFLGLLFLFAALLLFAGRTSGKRYAIYGCLLGVAAGLLAPVWFGFPLVLLALSVLILALLVLDVSHPARKPSLVAGITEATGIAVARFRESLPSGRAALYAERGALHFFLILFAAWSVLPLLTVIGTAFSDLNSMTTANIPLVGPYFLPPGSPAPTYSWDAFGAVFARECGDTPCFWLWLKNSLIVSTGTTLWGLFIALPAGYGFSRFSFRGKRAMMLSFLVVQMFPGAIILIPYYLLMQQLRLLENPAGLILAYSVTALPFMVWMLKGFFDTIPRDLEEAAMVDGTSQVGAFVRVILPLSLPALAVTALFSFLSAWNEWLLAFTFMGKARNFTLPVGISSLIPQAGQGAVWNQFAALSLLVSLPVIVLFIVFQKYLISGLTRGAVKG